MWTCGERLCVSVCREFRVDRQTRQVKKDAADTGHAIMLSHFTSWYIAGLLQPRCVGRNAWMSGRSLDSSLMPQGSDGTLACPEPRLCRAARGSRPPR